MVSLVLCAAVRNIRNAYSTLPLLRNKVLDIRSVLTVNYSTFAVKDFLYERSDETGTLLTRFAKHLALESNKFNALVPTTIRYSDFFPVHDTRVFYSALQKIDFNQLPSLIIFTFTYKTNGDPAKYVKVINEIDTMCTTRLSEMDYDTILRTLYSFLYLMPNKITRTNFYQCAVLKLVDDFKADFPKEKFVQVCFYLGLMKKNALPGKTELLKDFLKRHLTQNLDQLSSFDLALVISAAYKTSVTVSNEAFLKRLTEETIKVPVDDDAMLVNFIKSLRLNRVKSVQVCEKLTEICTLEAIRKFHLTGLVHIFAYFAESLWDNPQICSKLINEILHKLRSQDKQLNLQSDNIRAKDVATFTWCCAYLGTNNLLQTADFDFLVTLILRKVENNEYRFFPDQLINSCLSLWMLGHKCRDLLEKVVQLKINSKKCVNTADRSKLDTRYKVLLAAVEIEKPEWLSLSITQSYDEEGKVPEYLLKDQKFLLQVEKQLAQENDVNSVKIVCPIKNINVPGILVQFTDSKQKHFIEIIDKNQQLVFSHEPVSILKLKIRLLKHLGHNVVEIRSNDIFENKSRSIKDLVLSSTHLSSQNIAADEASDLNKILTA